MNSSLPVHLTSSNVKQNPEFAKLLTSLTRHLTNTGMSVTVHKDLMQVGDIIALKQACVLDISFPYSWMLVTINHFSVFLYSWGGDL